MCERPACSTFTFTNIRCGYTGHFYRGKWPFYCSNLAWCVWLFRDKFSIGLVTSKRRKKPGMTFNVVSSKQGLFDSQGKRANQLSSFENNMKPPKNFSFFCFVLFCFSFARLREIRDRMNWFVGPNLGTIFPPKKIVLLLACNRTMGCGRTVAEL